MSRILRFFRRLRTDSLVAPTISEETVRGWVEKSWNGPPPVRVLPLGYGNNRSFRIEFEGHPYKALLKTYQSPLAHARQRNEAASLKYLAPVLKGTVPEIYGEASDEEDTRWLLLEWKEGRCLADVFGDLRPEERSDVVMQCGRLCRKMHDLRASGVGPMSVEDGLDMSWSQFFFDQCERLLNELALLRALKKPLMSRVRTCLLEDGPAILKNPIQPVFLQNDFHSWNIQVERRDGRWEISGLFDFEFALRGDARLDLVWTAEAFLPISYDRASFSAGYGEDLDCLPIEIRRLYMAYRELLAVHFRRSMERFPRHLNSLVELLSK